MLWLAGVGVSDSGTGLVRLFDAQSKELKTPNILFKELRQSEMLERVCQLHSSFIVGRLSTFTELNLPGKKTSFVKFFFFLIYMK